jgi:hypothetical protein
MRKWENVPMYQCVNVPMIQFTKSLVYELVYEV